MIVVVAALKGGVGKTTTAVYLSAVAAMRPGGAILVDADTQASSADWLELARDPVLEGVTLVEAPTDRLLVRTLDHPASDQPMVVDTPPGNERLLAKATERASVVIVPTRVGGVETPQVEAVLDLVGNRIPVGLVICSARTFTRDYQETVTAWEEAGVPVWGTVPERVAIAAGPMTALAPEGLEAYRALWRRAQRAVG